MYSSKSCVRQDEGETVQECGEEAKAVQGYCEVIRRQVPVLTKAELHGLGGGLLLGVGGFGSVRLVGQENGAPAVVKELLQADQLLPVLKEATFLLQLGGAGGAPRLLGVCQAPPALVQEFVGQTYDTYLEVCSVKGFLESLQAVCQCLEEVHAKGIVHNDLKWNNITFSGSVNAPRFHIIDFGWASSSGSVVVEKEEGQSDEDSFTEASHSRQAPWMAPEVFGGGRVFPSGDVYSLGFLMGCLMDRCPHDFLTGPLRSLSRSCTARDASRRPSLARVAHCLAILASILTPHQLDQYFEEAEEEEEEEGKKKKEVGEDDDAHSDDEEEDEVDDKASEEDEGEKDDEDDDMMTKDKMKVEKCEEFDNVELESEEEEEDERGNKGECVESEEENKKEGNGNDKILTEEKQKKKEDGEEHDIQSEEEERDKGDGEEEDEGDEIEEKHEGDDREDKHIDDREEKHGDDSEEKHLDDREEKPEGNEREEKHEGDRGEKDSDVIDEKEEGGDDIEEEDNGDDIEEEDDEG
ncbi:probable serine/threonine-protein kinase kinX [Scylla paramamosain]|uniref:probable serine/threonine-protein kinase kinX n=1 Tax=Scylla paramamosain TaxID=85552 RepID=UPI0030836F6E